MKKLIGLLLCAALLLGCCPAAFAADAGAAGTLAFRPDGTFKILHLTDTQDDHHPAAQMLQFLAEAIEREQPDLIVFTGDLVEDWRLGDRGTDDDPLHEGVCVYRDIGRNTMDVAATKANVEAASDAVLSIFEQSGIPFAIAQGNNDHKVGMTNEDWLALYGRYAMNLTFDESDDPDGRIDYHLEIKGSDGATACNLWLMDTGRNGISDASVAWYQSAASAQTAVNGGEPIPAFVFQHIQAPDIGNLFEECGPLDSGARGKGGKFYRLKDEETSGSPFYAWTPCEPSAEFRAWKEQGDVIAAYFGHQHIEGFSGRVDGIELGFTYGLEVAKPGPYGYRTVTLHEDDVAAYSTALYGETTTAGDALLQFLMEAPGQPITPAQRVAVAFKALIASVISTVVSLFA